MTGGTGREILSFEFWVLSWLEKRSENSELTTQNWAKPLTQNFFASLARIRLQSSSAGVRVCVIPPGHVVPIRGFHLSA